MGLTPLRQPIFGAGGEPDEGVLFFRSYNAFIIVIVALMTLGLLKLRRERRASRTRTFTAAWWTVAAAHAFMIAGSLPAVLFGGQARALVMAAASDVGFLAAVVAAVGARLLHLRSPHRSRWHDRPGGR